MKKKTVPFPLLISCVAMICLILDSQCASTAAAQAVKQCLYTVIPSLFPLFVLSGYISPLLTGVHIPWLSKFCRIPKGTENIFLLGLLGGFPIGAQCISQASLEKKDAQRMLGFCSNCGPAFIFGILTRFFRDPMVPFVLLTIQAAAALCIAHLWRGTAHQATPAQLPPINISQAVYRAIRSMAAVCAWIILGNVILAFGQRWLFPFLPPIVCIVLSGLLELTSGCLLLPSITSESLRLILAAGFLCFGGVCVHLQIHAIVSAHGISMLPCLCQKIMQALLGVLFAVVYIYTGYAGMLLLFFAILALKKAVEKIVLLLYNDINKGGIPHAVSQTD